MKISKSKGEVVFMPGVVIVGTQWGDEAKGKITDFLAKDADCIVRYMEGQTQVTQSLLTERHTSST